MNEIELLCKILLAKPEDCEHLFLSVSKTKTFKDCKAKYRFSYVEKLPKKDRDYHIFGKFLHAILEHFYKQIIAGNTDPNNVILTASWKHAFQEWKEKLTKEQIIEARELCKLFLKKLATEKNNYQVLSVEEPFYIDIDGKVLLNGFIDRVQRDADGILHVADYKTTKKKQYLKNDFFQLMTYAFVMCLKDPSLQEVRGSYILLRHGFDSLPDVTKQNKFPGKVFKREDIMKIGYEFLDYAEKIHSEKLFRPNVSRLCLHCDFLDKCDEGLDLAAKISGYQNIKYGTDSW